MMAQTISLIVPSRKRNEKLKQFLDSARKHCSNETRIQVIVFIDDDDTSYEQKSFKQFTNITFITGPRTSMGACLRECIRHAEGAYIWLLNDDILVESAGWDDVAFRAIKKFDSDHFLIYPDDKFKGKNLATFPLISKSQCLSYDMIPGMYQGSHIDAHIHEIFLRLKCLGYDRTHFSESIIFRHLHHRATNDAPDSTYLARKRFADDYHFFSTAIIRQAIAKKFVKELSKNNGVGTAGQHLVMHASFSRSLADYFFGRSLGIVSSWKIIIRYLIRFLIGRLMFSY